MEPTPRRERVGSDLLSEMVNEKTHFTIIEGGGKGKLKGGNQKTKEGGLKLKEERGKRVEREGKTFDGKGVYTNTREGIKTIFKTTFILF